MRKVFQSYDGLIFEDEEKCAEYEREASPGFIMYDSDGETHDPNKAFLVVITDKSGAKSFISMCNKDETPYQGIDENSTGIFVWARNQIYDVAHYVKIPDVTSRAFNRYFADIK